MIGSCVDGFLFGACCLLPNSQTVDNLQLGNYTLLFCFFFCCHYCKQSCTKILTRGARPARVPPPAVKCCEKNQFLFHTSKCCKQLNIEEGKTDVIKAFKVLVSKLSLTGSIIGNYIVFFSLSLSLVENDDVRPLEPFNNTLHTSTFSRPTYVNNVLTSSPPQTLPPTEKTSKTPEVVIAEKTNGISTQGLIPASEEPEPLVGLFETGGLFFF